MLVAVVTINCCDNKVSQNVRQKIQNRKEENVKMSLFRLRHDIMTFFTHTTYAQSEIRAGTITVRSTPVLHNSTSPK